MVNNLVHALNFKDEIVCHTHIKNMSKIISFESTITTIIDIKAQHKLIRFYFLNPLDSLSILIAQNSPSL